MGCRKLGYENYLKYSFILAKITFMNIKKSLGKKIKDLRKRRWRSQEALGTYCGLHRNHIGAIERGEKNVTIETLQQLADTFRVPVQELFKFK